MPAIKRLATVPSDEFCPRVTSFTRPAKHFRYLNAANGDWLATQDGATLHVQEFVDDAAIWDIVEGGFQHAATGLRIATSSTELDSRCHVSLNDKAIAADGSEGEASEFTIAHGPEEMPSQYLKTL
ncbi:MAG: hypothetical protein F4W90_08855, partial [Gammaproteobacteria bacterium]|nr:hypothetical protein [Gammaproteobacteria bacterium]